MEEKRIFGQNTASHPSPVETSFCAMKILFCCLFPLFIVAQNAAEIHSGSAQAAAFVGSLTDAQRQKTVFAFDETSRYEWHFVPASMIGRSGIPVKSLDSVQKIRFYAMLQSYLSAEGYQRTRDVMDYEYLLKEMEPNNANRIPENYFVTLYGSPDKDSTWAWKFTGHHVTLNFTVVKDRLEFAPFFFGVYPAEIKSGPKKGARLIRAEEDLGFELIHSFTLAQRSKAIFQLKAFAEIVTTNAEEVSPLNPAGILAADLTIAQKATLNKLIVAYLASMTPAMKTARMKKIVAEDMNAIRFGWAGGTEPGLPHYYRVQGKTFLMEFDNTQSGANHIHTVWRDFNGDFGRDLLREHYQTSPHHKH